LDLLIKTMGLPMRDAKPFCTMLKNWKTKCFQKANYMPEM